MPRSSSPIHTAVTSVWWNIPKDLTAEVPNLGASLEARLALLLVLRATYLSFLSAWFLWICHISSTWMPFTALKALAGATLHSPGMYGSQLPSLDLLKANISPLQPLFPVSKCCIKMKLQHMTVAQQTTSQDGEWLVTDQINQLTPPASSGPHSDTTN